MTVDYAHTARARHNREVRTLAGVASVSEETWHEVVQILAADPPPAGPRPRGCDLPGCAVVETRLYLCGWRCDAHSPAALAGRVIPVPPPGTTDAELRAARPTAAVEHDPRVLVAKEKATTAAARARLAEHVARTYRATGRDP